jgi:hypothetical protein
MSPAKPPRYHQARLPFARKSLWDRFPEATRDRCRKALIEFLQSVVMGATAEINSHERED